MTAQTRATLKTYFETGDKPTQAQFINLIDSFLSLSDTASQTVKSPIIVSGAVSCKGTLTVDGAVNLAGGGTTLTVSADTNNGSLVTTACLTSALNGYLTTTGAASIYAPITSASLVSPSLGVATATSLLFPASGATALNDYHEGTWTPSDASGGSLTFTNTANNCLYTKIGRLVIASFMVTFPTTADSNNATIGGLPYAALSTTSNDVFSVCLGYTDYATAITARVGGGQSYFTIYNFSGTQITNANLSGKTIRGQAIYMV